MKPDAAVADRLRTSRGDEEDWLEPVSWADRPGGWRWGTRIQAHVRPMQGRYHQVELLDLSTRGCRLRTVMFRPGQQVWIGVGNIEPRIASVAWVDVSAAGLRFRDPLHPSVVEHFAFTKRPS